MNNKMDRMDLMSVKDTSSAIEMSKKTKKNILVTDLNRNIIFCNEAWTELCGYSLSEIYGKNCKFLQNV